MQAVYVSEGAVGQMLQQWDKSKGFSMQKPTGSQTLRCPNCMRVIHPDLDECDRCRH